MKTSKTLLKKMVCNALYINIDDEILDMALTDINNFLIYKIPNNITYKNENILNYNFLRNDEIQQNINNDYIEKSKMLNNLIITK